MKNKSIKLQGISASLGTGEGFVVYVKKLSDLTKVDKHKVMVTDKITTEYREGFSRCSAVIATKGGVTSHVAIVCREIGKPCIVACSNAFEVLKEGQRVKIDAGLLSVAFIDIDRETQEQ